MEKGMKKGGLELLTLLKQCIKHLSITPLCIPVLE